MNPQELLKQMVMSESQEERMTIAEKLTEILSTQKPENLDELIGKITDLETALEKANGDLQASNQKYIDRFFTSETPKEEKPKEEEEKPITTEDIINEMGGKN